MSFISSKTLITNNDNDYNNSNNNIIENKNNKIINNNNNNKDSIKTNNSLKINKKSDDLKELIEENFELINKFKLFINSDLVKNYSFDLSEITNIKIDLSFFNISILGENNVVDFIKNQIKINPEIKPLMHVLKRYLSLNKLNSSFNGGLSSYSLLLMVIAYVRYPKISNIPNLGAMLNGFLEFYGKYFNFNQLIIYIANSK